VVLKLPRGVGKEPCSSRHAAADKYKRENEWKSNLILAGSLVLLFLGMIVRDWVPRGVERGATSLGGGGHKEPKQTKPEESNPEGIHQYAVHFWLPGIASDLVDADHLGSLHLRLQRMVDPFASAEK